MDQWRRTQRNIKLKRKECRWNGSMEENTEKHRIEEKKNAGGMDQWKRQRSKR